jgi:hypothetical protein
MGALVAAAWLTRADVIKPGIVWDLQDDGFRSVALVGEEVFGVDAGRKLYAKYEASAPKALVISVYPTVEEGSLLAGKGHTDVTFDDWERMYYARHGHESLRAMQLIAIGKNAVLKIADHGHVSRVILRGDDPTIVDAGGRRCQILTLSFHHLPRPIRADGQNPTIVNLDVQVDSVPDDSQAKAITRALWEKLGRVTVDVSMRADNWFIEDQSFPAWYPFAKDDGPSSLADYRSHGEVGCRSDQSEVRCSRSLYGR